MEIAEEQNTGKVGLATADTDIAGATEPTDQPETTKDRLRLILGEEGLHRLGEATVMVVGLGGVGSNCAEALARGGVGNLVLLDRDVVAPSNVNRQAIAFTSTIGRAKAEPRGEQEQAGRDEDDAAVGEDGPHALLGKPQLVSVEKDQRGAHDHQASQKGHDR